MARLKISGFTLVELMISTGLFGYVAIMSSTLFSEGMKMVITARAQADFTQQIISFNDAIDSIVANTTRVVSCGCNATCTYVASGGGFPAASPAATTILEFDSDTANNPGDTAAGACIGATTTWSGFTGAGATSGIAPSLSTDYQYYPRGCKERFQLLFSPPSPNTTTDGGANFSTGQPGTLKLVKLTAGGGSQTMAQVTGAYDFNCGYESGAPTGFRMEVKAKTKAVSMPYGPSGSVESFSPLDTAMFLKGIHRMLSLNIQFRNLSNEAIQFGRTISYRGCTPDNQPSTDGNCCSGYYDRAAGNCIAPTGCLVSGAAAVGAWEKCCSHKTYVPASGEVCT